MTHKHHTASWPRCIECNQPAEPGSEYCDGHSPDLRECDCCGQYKADVKLIWCDSVGDTLACPKCRGWETDEVSQ